MHSFRPVFPLNTTRSCDNLICMKITKDEVKHIAWLARLELSESEIELYTKQLNDILLYMEKLNRVDTGNVEPLSHPFFTRTVFRDDIVKGSLPQEKAIENAPQRAKGFFRVPKIIEE